MNLHRFASLLNAIFLALVLTSIALPCFAISKTQMVQRAQHHVATVVLEQMKKTLDGLSGAPIETAIDRWGFPAEEKVFLGTTYVVWRNIGREMNIDDLSKFTGGWVNTQSVSDAVSSIKFANYGLVGSDSVEKTQCIIFLGVDDQKRINSWRIGRDSSLEQCGPMMNVKGSLKRLVKKEASKLEKEYEKGKIWITGGKDCGSSALSKPIHTIAILPFHTNENRCFSVTRPSDQQLASALQTVLQRDGSLSVVYSHYDNPNGISWQTNLDELWDSTAPTARTFEIGKELGADAVMTSWRWVLGSGYCSNRIGDTIMDLYLLDVHSQCSFSIRGDEGNVDALKTRLLTGVLSGQVRQAEATTQKK